MWEARFTWKARQILYHVRDSDRKSQTGKRRTPFSNCVLTSLRCFWGASCVQNPFGVPLFCITYEGNGGACVQLVLPALGPLLSLSLWPPGNQPLAPSSGSFKCTQLLTFCTSSRTTDGIFPHDYCIILPYEALS